MESQPGLLAAIIAQKSDEYAASYAAFAAAIQQAVDRGELVARHGPDHWRNVSVLAARMVPEKVFQQMAAGEAMLLALGSIAHDVGLPGQTGHDHLVDEAAKYGIEPTLAIGLRIVCDAISSQGRRLRRMPRWTYLGRDAVDLRRTAAVLLIADRIDLEHSDVPPPPDAEDLPERISRWPQERGLSVGLIDPREGVLRLDLTLNNKVWRREIEQHYQPAAAAVIDLAKDILLAGGMPFRELELHDLHAKPTADVARAQEAMRARAGVRRRPQRPFKMLDAFGEDESHLLAARDDEILRLAGRTLTSPVTVLTGETGVGKTSLVAAGVIPWLREHDYDAVYARCFDDPTQAVLEACLDRLETLTGVRPKHDNLTAAVRQLAELAAPPILLVLDQGQELFTRLGSRTRLEFAKDLAGMLSLSGEPVHVLLVIQREFFVNLAELLDVLPTILHEVMELRRLSPDQAETVIRRSLGRFRARFDGLVTSHLVDDLSSAEGILPVELQICCDALYQQLEEGEYTVGFEIYRKAGPARRILETLVDTRLRGLRWRRHALAKSLLVNAVTSQRTKALVTAEECAVDIGADLETTGELLDELIELGLLRRLKQGQKVVYELRHEYLALRLEAWISDIEREAKDVDDLLHRELNNYEKFQLLLDREKLRLIHQYRRRLTFTPEELELVIRSAAEQRFEMDYWFSRVNELSVSQQMVLSVDLLYSPELDTREALRSMISRLDHQAVLPTLLDSLREADAAVRETAIEVLREIDQNLVRALEKGDTTTQQQAAYALGQIGARHAVRPLVESAQHAAEEVREQAVEALAEIDRTRSAELLMRSLRTGNARSRWNAAAALGRLGRDQVIRDRIRREAERPEAGASLLYAYVHACLEGRHFEDAERALKELERRAFPDSEQPRIDKAWEDLKSLRKQQARGLFTWPMYRGSAGGSAYTPQGLQLPLELKWEFATGDCVYSSPAVAGGAVFIGSTDRHLYALDADSGTEIWTYNAGAEIRSSPCVLNGRVYFGSLDGQVHAVEQESGRALWAKRFGDRIESSVRGLGERLNVGTSDGGLVTFGPDGEILWRATLPGAVDASPAADENLVAVGTAEAGLVVFEAGTGRELWRWQVAGGLRGSPVIVDGLIAIGAGDGRVELLDHRGALRWAAFLGAAINSSPAIAHGRLIVAAENGEVAALDQATGERIWSFRAEGEMSASPTVAGKLVFVGSHAGQLYALAADSGTLQWRYRTGYSIHSTPAVADGRLFVALRYYNMCAFAEPVEVEDVVR